MKNLKHGDELLRQIVEGLRAHAWVKVQNVQVTFSDTTRHNCFVFSLVFALDAIAQDLYWDETGDWSECNTATVDVF